MDEEIYGGIVTFRYTKDNIELLLLNYGDGITHPKSKLEGDDNIEMEIIKEFYDETGLSLVVASLQPIYQFNSVERVGKTKIKKSIYYFAGIADPDQEVLLRDVSFEYLWTDHLGGRNSISLQDDIYAYKTARRWLYAHDEAALFLANNLQKLL
ncbi:MAG: hypothetical protein ACC656_14425 [Candidatus Heimdallarchaeota archaeon]